MEDVDDDANKNSCVKESAAKQYLAAMAKKLPPNKPRRQ